MLFLAWGFVETLSGVIPGVKSIEATSPGSNTETTIVYPSTLTEVPRDTTNAASLDYRQMPKALTPELQVRAIVNGQLHQTTLRVASRDIT